MTTAFDARVVHNGFIDGDNTKTLALTIANVTGRFVVALVRANAGTDAGSGMTCAGNAMTALATGTDSSGLAFRAYHIDGDANIPVGSQNFVLTANNQISCAIVVAAFNGIDDAVGIEGTPQYFDGTTTDPSVGGHASWTGDTAAAIGLGATSNFNTIGNGTGVTLDFGGTPASPQAFGGRRAGGNVAVAFTSDHADSFVLVGLSVAEPGPALTEKFRIPTTAADGVSRKLWVFTDTTLATALVSNQTVVASGGFFTHTSSAGVVGTSYPAILATFGADETENASGGPCWATVIEE